MPVRYNVGVAKTKNCLLSSDDFGRTDRDAGGDCMRQYQLKETKEINKIVCNQCGKEIEVSEGTPREGVFSVDYAWGYFSDKDGERHSFDLCESCYDKLLASFKLPADIEE